jgi:hypothetical protein
MKRSGGTNGPVPPPSWAIRIVSIWWPPFENRRPRREPRLRRVSGGERSPAQKIPAGLGGSAAPRRSAAYRLTLVEMKRRFAMRARDLMTVSVVTLPPGTMIR